MKPRTTPAARMSWALALAICTLLGALTPQRADAAATASDDACQSAYSGGWANGNNGGSGWGAGWAMTPNANTGNAGVFRGSSLGNANGATPSINGACGNAWGMFANNNNQVEAVRTFATANGSASLQVGQSFQIDMDSGFDNSTSSGGFTLRSGASTTRMEFVHRSGQANYEVNDNAGFVSTGVGFTGGGLTVKVTITGSGSTYDIAITPKGGSTTTLTGRTLANSGGIDRVRLYRYNNESNPGGNGDYYFNAMSVSCSGTVTITNSPVSLTNCANTTFTYSVSGIAGSSPTYQWQVSVNGGSSWNSVTQGSGGTTTSYSTNATAAADANQYRCIVTDACGNSVTSSVANLSITANTAIQSQPASTNVCQGNPASFTVAATGVTAYQWQISTDNGASFNNVTSGTGGTTPTYSTNAAATANGNQFRVVLTGCSGLTTSAVATVTVNPTSVGGSISGTSVVCSGNGTTLTLSGNTGSIQWQSRTGANAFANISGETSATLNTGALTTTTDFRALVTSGVCSSTVSTTNTVTVNPTSVGGTVAPASATICSGSSTTLTNTSFTGVNQWQVSTDGVNFTPIANATNATVSVSPTQTSYYYSVVTSGVCSSANSTTNTVTVNTAPAITGQPQAVTQCSGNSVTFSVTNTGTAPSYQWRRVGTGWGTGNAWTLTAGGGGFFVAASTNNGGGTGGIDVANKSWGLFNSSGGTAEAVRNFTALSVGQVIQVDMDNGSINTGGPTVGFGLRNASGQNLVEFYFRGGQSFYEINRSGGAIFTTLPFTANGVRVTVTVTSSTTFSLTALRLNDNASFGPYTGTFLNSGSISQFRGFNFNAGSGSAFDLFFNNLKVGPSAATPFFEDNASSYSTATWINGSNLGSRPLTNSATYANVTTSNLTINAATSAEAGSYDTIIYNSCGGVTSTSAALTVNASPVATFSSVIRSNGAAVKVAFTNLTGNVAGVGVSSVSATTSGGQPLTIDNAWTMVYVPVGTTNSETFTYTVTNANCSASGTVTVSVVGGTPGQTSGSISVSGNLATLTFFGVPGTSYTVERSTNGMATWQPLTTVIAPVTAPVGVINFTNDVSGDVPVPASAFYRLVP